MSYWAAKPAHGCGLNRTKAASLGLSNLWLITEPGGGEILDCIGGANGLLSSGATLRGSASGNSLGFGTSGQCAVCPSVAISGSVTMFWWGMLYDNTVNSADLRGLLVKGQFAGGNFLSAYGDCCLALSQNVGGKFAATMTIYTNSTTTDDEGDTSDTGLVGIGGSSAVPVSVPLLIVGTFDETANVLALYLNGNQIARGNGGQNDDGSAGVLVNNSHLLEHGAWPGDESNTSLNGVELMAGIASRAWSPAEIAAFNPLSLFAMPAARKTQVLIHPVGAPFLFDSEMTGFGQQMGF